MAVTDSLLASFERIVEEDFGKGVTQATKDIDPWSKKLVDSSMGVARDGLGKNWKKIQVFKTGLAGAATWRSVVGPAPVTGTTANDKFTTYGTAAAFTAPQTFPGAEQITFPSYVQSEVQLKEMYGNFQVPVEVMRIDMIPTNVGNHFEAILEGASRRVALREILAFWAHSQSTLGTSSGAYVTGVASQNITCDAGGDWSGTSTAITNSDGITRYDLLRLQDGECVDIWEWSGAAWVKLNGTVPYFVALTDDLGISFKLVGFSGSDVTLTSGRTFELHPFGSATGSTTTTITSNQPTPLSGWIKSSGTVFGLNLANYPFFKSLVKALSAGEQVLTEQVLNRYINGFLTSKPHAGRIDTLVTTPGVKSKYVNNLDFTGRRDRFAMPVSLNEGYTEKWNYQRDGYELMVETSNFCPEGNLYGLVMRNGNIKKITPPQPGGVGKHPKFGEYVEFFGKITGNSIFVPVRDNTASRGSFTDWVEAPFKRWLEYMPDSFCGVRLTGLAEDIASS